MSDNAESPTVSDITGVSKKCWNLEGVGLVEQQREVECDMHFLFLLVLCALSTIHALGKTFSDSCNKCQNVTQSFLAPVSTQQ